MGSPVKDPLGSRMKDQYENRFRHFLPRRTYTLIRADGKAFHTYTRGLERPYDKDFCSHMAQTARYMCENLHGALFAFVQSDEISILLTDFKKDLTSAMFDGNIQKISSISASYATGFFNTLRPGHGMAHFDARCFVIPDPVEVENYFIWRQQDATRNSISMATQSVYSHRELHKKGQAAMQELLHKKGINWNDYPIFFKRGQGVIKTGLGGPDVSNWDFVDVPVFTQDRSFLRKIIPQYNAWEPISQGQPQETVA